MTIIAFDSFGSCTHVILFRLQNKPEFVYGSRDGKVIDRLHGQGDVFFTLFRCSRLAVVNKDFVIRCLIDDIGMVA